MSPTAWPPDELTATTPSSPRTMLPDPVRIGVVVLVFLLLNRAALERSMPNWADRLRLVEFALVLALSGLGIVRRPSGPVQRAVLLFVAVNVAAYLWGSAYIGAGPPAFAVATSLGYLSLAATQGLHLPEAWLARVMVLCAVPGLLLGTRQGVFGLSAGEVAAVSGSRATYLVDGQIRLPGSFGTGQEFSVWLAILVLLTLGQVLGRGPSRARHAHAGVLLLSAALLVMALQRTALIVAAVGAAVALVADHRDAPLHRKLKAALGATGAGAAILGISALAAPERTRIGLERLVFGSQTSTVAGRFSSLWSDAVGRILDWPVLGGGPGSATAASFDYRDALSVDPLVTDNMALHIATQSGLLGLAVFAFLCGALWRQASGRPWAQGLLAGLLVGGIAASLLGLVGVMGLVMLLLGAETERDGSPEPV